jgi:DNA polymerase-3 subunit delta
MSKAISAVSYLKSPTQYPPKPVCAVFGTERFLKQHAIQCLRKAILQDEQDEFSLTRFDGKTATMGDVLDELSTLAMFGSHRRLVLIEEADRFVEQHRTELEDYLEHPSKTGTLILQLQSLPSNTRLYKAIARSGLLIQCATPKEKELVAWITDWARTHHGVSFTREGAEMLLELVGPEMGMLDQEIGRIALLAPPDEPILPDLVSETVGTWRSKTAWEMLDAALAGKTGEALSQLHRLLLAGEHPIGILAQISSNLRRLATATERILLSEKRGHRLPLSAALEEAGVKRFVLKKTERQLMTLGRHRGKRLIHWLLEADLDLKGGQATDPRTILERLLVRISNPSLKEIPR